MADGKKDVKDYTETDFIAIFLTEMEDLLSNWESSCLDIARSQSPDAYQKLLFVAHNAKGGAGLVGLKGVNAVIHRAEKFIGDLQKGIVKPTAETSAFLLKIEEQLKLQLGKVKVDPTYSPEFPELMAAMENMTSNVGVQQTEAPTRVVLKKAEKILPKTVEDTIRVSSGKIDRLIDLVGELTLHQEIVFRAKEENALQSSAAVEAINICHKVTKEVQSLSTELRMLPIQGLFQRLERMVVGIATTQGKSVLVNRQGEDVVLDKTVIEGLTDPLIHILRNAIDHGVAGPTTSSNKFEVSMVAKNEASGVVIEVSDNGNGIDDKKVYDKAVKLGIVEAGKQLSHEEILEFIFADGFSTREEVSDISGRGIGMSIVRRKVLDMGGSLFVESEVGRGTKFRIVVPTTLSILDAIIVSIADKHYVVPVQDLSEIIDLEQYTSSQNQDSRTNQNMVDLRGQIIPVRALSEFLQSSGRNRHVEANTNAQRPALIFQDGIGKKAFSVDAIIGQQQIFIRPLSKNLSGTQSFSGATILSDGEPGMILNLRGIAKMADLV